ncbi:MAG: hypothetical protein HY891_05790 [Deltaproteobacteria bacterium]|nr:hypothetical protein [Deltaproteobacteria bacterium]
MKPVIFTDLDACPGEYYSGLKSIIVNFVNFELAPLYDTVCRIAEESCAK